MVGAKWEFPALAPVKCEGFASPGAPPGLAWRVRMVQPSLGIPFGQDQPWSEAWQC